MQSWVSEKSTPLARHHGQNQIQDVRVRISLPEKHCSTLSIGLLHPSCNAVWSISSAIRCLWQPVCACMSDSNNWTEGFRRGLSEIMEFPSSRSSCPWHHSERVQDSRNRLKTVLFEEMLSGRLWGYFSHSSEQLFFALSILYLGHSFSYCCALGLCIEST